MAYGNYIFSTNAIKNNSPVTKVRRDREYLLSNTVADELNTYRMWDRFASFNDVYVSEYDGSGKELGSVNLGAPAVRSIFNRAGAILTGSEAYDVTNGSSAVRMSMNVPLMDSPSTRRTIRENSDCSVRALVQGSADGLLGKNIYGFSDFMYCKYLGRLPNTYLITLRRFPIPVDDYIGSMGLGSTRKNKGFRSENNASVGCLVTWLGTPGNEMSNILSYNFSMPFTEDTAQWEDVPENADAGTGLLNSIAAACDPSYRAAYMAGIGGSALNSYVGKLWGGKDGPYQASDFLDWRDKHKVYGPVDAIKSTYRRDDKGLQFGQDITITFDYELRSYNGINGRQAMLDLLANILAVTYSTGTFWGGGYRGNAMHQNNIFSNLEIYKVRSGSFTGFLDAITKDCTTIGESLKSAIDTSGGILKMLKSALNQLGGMILGGALNRLGRPHKQMVHSLLSPAPVGFWHLTIGNPWHPIMSMGNMILKDTKVEHYGPLGLDDFPTGLKVTCTLTRGKPRDSRGIEQMYMGGNDRIYTSMGPKIADMYKAAKEYKSNTVPSQTGSVNSEPMVSEQSEVSSNSTNVVVMKKETTIGAEKLRMDMDKYMRFFGTSDMQQITIVASEQEYGSQPPKGQS